jgi:glucosyl-dolichyl phosphate glucuronosyltransferase
LSATPTHPVLVAVPPVESNARVEPQTCCVAICVHTMERFEQIRRCVDSVVAGSRPPDEMIVVVDGNRPLRDRLVETLPSSVVVVENDGKGLADGRTMALRLASSSIVAFIDDDAWADACWLDEIIAVFDDPEVFGAGGRVMPDWEDASAALPDEIWWIVGSTYRGHRESPGPMSRPIGANMAVRRRPLLVLGGFPSSFGRQAGVTLRSNEELAAFTSVTSAHGADCVRFVPLAVVHHFAPAERCTWRYVVRRSKAEGTSKADVRRQFGPATMGHDRAYARDIVPRAVATSLWSGIRHQDRRALRHAGLIVAAFVVTCAAYLARLAATA